MSSLATFAIPIHAIAASCVILIGPINIIRKRRDRPHRILGRSWVICMYLVCISGMFIYTLSGGFTIFHGLAIFTFGTTTLGVINARKRLFQKHAGYMIGSYIGAVIAGIFAATVHGRTIPTLAIEDPTLLWSIIAIVITSVTLWVIWVLVFLRRKPRKRRTTKTVQAVRTP